MQDKYKNKINNLIEKTLLLSKKVLLKTVEIDSRYYIWYENYLNGVSDTEIQELFKMSKEKVNKIKAYVIRNLKKKNHEYFHETLNTLNKIIKINFTNEKRYLSVSPEYSNLYRILRDNSYKLIENTLVDPNYFRYINQIIMDNPIKIKTNFLNEISNKESFMNKYLGGSKTFIHDGYVFYDKHVFLKWYFSSGDIIDMEKNFLNMPNSIRAKSVRAQTASLERYNYLIKVNKTSFMYKDPKIIKYYLKNMYIRIKEAIEKDSIYKFADIKKNVIKTEEEKILFPNDALYYIVKEFNINDFNFDKGNRKIIYSKKKIVQSLKEFLKLKYPEGIAKIDMEILKKEGFSKTININSNLIYGNNLYIAENKIQKIKSIIMKYFSTNKFLFTIPEIANNTNNEIKYIMNNFNIYLIIANWFEEIVYINGVFLNISNELNKKDEEKIITFIGDYLVDRFSNDNFISALSFNDKSQIGKFFQAKSYLTKDILKYIYNFRQITQTKKILIKEFFKKIDNN